MENNTDGKYLTKDDIFPNRKKSQRLRKTRSYTDLNNEQNLRIEAYTTSRRFKYYENKWEKHELFPIPEEVHTRG